MRFYAIAAVVLIFLSSCLKQSIADAMLDEKNSGGRGKITATLSYSVNGNPVNLSVSNAFSQNPDTYTLGCSKPDDHYILTGLTSTGDFNFLFYTDSITVGTYEYDAGWRENYFMSYNGQSEFIYGGSDFMKLTVTSYTNGHISGNFTGRLTPLVMAGSVNNIYGDPGSILITNGLFENVPVFY